MCNHRRTQGPVRRLQTAALLEHPAFAGWFWRDDATVRCRAPLGAAPSAALRAQQIGSLATAHFIPELIASYQRRLEAMARWLALAGQPDPAAMAMSAVHQLTSCPPDESPFVRRLIGIGLDIAAVSLQAGRN